MEGRVKRENKKDVKGYVIVAVIVGVVLFILIKVFLAQGFSVSTAEMEDALEQGDIILATHLFDEKSLEKGDVVVFEYPPDPSQYRIGRIVAEEGQMVQIVSKKLYIDGEAVENSSDVKFIDPQIKNDFDALRDNFGPYMVPTRHFFIMGDNRDRSNDSRFWGALPQDMVICKPLFVYFSWKPDPYAPEITSIMSVPSVFLYNLTHFLNRARLGRIGKPVK